MPEETENRLYYVHGFGEAGEANCYAFAPFPGKKQIRELEVNETTEGRFTNPTSDKKPERITRVR